MSFFEELKRRNVVRVGVAYIVAAWVIAQVADLVLENIGAPDWVIQTLLLLLALGFVAALIIAWAYEVTPEGIKRESEVDRSTSVTETTGRKLNIVTIMLVFVALAVFAFDRLSPDTPEGEGVTPAVAAGSGATSAVAARDDASRRTTGTTVATTSRSIAVLPFVALSVDENDAFFGKGIAEELLNALAQFADLKVAARTSAFSFDGKDVDLREVGEALDVAHVLEGSVRRSGDRLRITAQLIRTDDGFHLWSETYERTMTDIFEIQDEIVSELARVLQFRLGVGVGSGRAANKNIDPSAYELYLQGLELWWTREIDSNRDDAIATFRRVTELDPDFADAWAAYAVSMTLSNSANAPFLTDETFEPEIESAFERALSLDPDNARAHAGLAFWHNSGRVDPKQALFYMQRALELSPNGAFANYAAANVYLNLGDPGRTLDQFDRAFALDPLNLTVERVRIQAYATFGKDVPVSEAFRRIATCDTEICEISHGVNNFSLLMSALARNGTQEIRRYLAHGSYILERLAQPAPGLVEYFDFVFAGARAQLGEPVDASFWQGVDIDSLYFRNQPWSSCPNLARHGRVAECIELLRTAYKRGETFPSVLPYATLSAGPMEMPDIVRRDPRYHELWALPGLAELAAIRRANGAEAGLPMPIDQ